MKFNFFLIKIFICNRNLLWEKNHFFFNLVKNLENGIQDVYILGEDEGVILKCIEAFQDQQDGTNRNPGDRWMIRGPT